MNDIYYIERTTGLRCKEKVYGHHVIKLLYGSSLSSRLFGRPCAHLLARIPFFSSFYGYLQKRKWTVKKISPFIKAFDVDVNEFADEISSFKSFNDFFTRHLKRESRPIATGSNIAIIPADGRYLFYQNIEKADGFVVKGEKFNLAKLLDSQSLADEYANGSMVIARLCPSDYHRYHFPCDCTPEVTKFINGWLYSVNPVAIKKNIDIFSQNKRTVCCLNTKSFGNVLFIEIGATFVGAIHQTHEACKPCLKGDEKGYFSFGGSSLILLFPPNSITFDADLLAASSQYKEIRCLMGESMGESIKF